MSSETAAAGLTQLFETTFKNQPEFRLYISSYLELIKQSNSHFDEAQISLAEQNLWAEFYRQCLQAMGEVSFDCLVILDASGKILGLNKLAERVLGRPSRDLIGVSAFEKFFPTAQGQEYYQCVQEGQKDPNTNLFSRRWDIVLNRANGSIFPIELRLNRLKIFGSSVLVASFNDVTKQKWTFDALHFNEERYRKIVNENADAVFLIDPQTKKITEANPAFNVMLGYNADEMFSLTLYDIMEGEPLKIDEWIDFRRFRGTELLVRDEARFLNKANQWLDVEVSCSVFEQREKHVVCLIARDTSERKILKRPRLLLEKLQSSGLETSLGEISRLIQELVPSKGQKEKLSELRTLHQHVCELIEGALPPEPVKGLTQNAQNGMVLPCQPFSLRAVVNSLKFLFHQTAQTRGLQIFHSVEDDVPDAFSGEPNRLQHILYQLLDNALRHTEQGNILVKVRLAEQNDHSATLLFMIRDTGHGIDETTQEGIRRLFETGALPKGLTFKGLTQAKQYINDLEGKIWFNSLRDQGSTFLFNLQLAFSDEEPRHIPDFDPETPAPAFLPSAPEPVQEKTNTSRIQTIANDEIAEEAEAEEELPEETRTQPVNESAQTEAHEYSAVPALPVNFNPEFLEGLEPCAILLVDDDLETMLEFQQFSSGYPVIFSYVDNGRKAIEMFKEKAFDLLLMDLNMPVMNGRKSTEHIRNWEKKEDRGQTPIVGLLSEGDSPEDQEGFMALVKKPQTQEELLSVLVQHIPLWSDQIALLQPAEPETETSDSNSTETTIAHIGADMAEHAPAFLEKRQQDLVRIEEALNNGDFGLIRVLGKSMKSAGGIFGFTGITEIGEAMEKGATSSNQELIAENLIKLRNYLNSVQIVVNS